jgi:predicted NUDIX family NTP pyrophosphohydrolase
MPKLSAGLLLYRRIHGHLEVLLVHPGGPLWTKKDAGAWSIPKGEVDPGEDELVAAKREFVEEVGEVPEGELLSLGTVQQKGGKVVRAWAVEGDCDTTAVTSNTFTMEWPPRSGKQREFPEIDRAEFFSLDEAREKINQAQAKFLSVLAELLSGGGSEQSDRDSEEPGRSSGGRPQTDLFG